MFSLICATPEKLVVNEEVEAVVLPGEEGYFCVLQGHAPTMMQLKEGMMELIKGQEAHARFYITGGFCEVTPLACRVLMKEAVPLNISNKADLLEEVARLQEKDLHKESLEAQESLKFLKEHLRLIEYIERIKKP